MVAGEHVFDVSHDFKGFVIGGQEKFKGVVSGSKVDSKGFDIDGLPLPLFEEYATKHSTQSAHEKKYSRDLSGWLAGG